MGRDQRLGAHGAAYAVHGDNPAAMGIGPAAGADDQQRWQGRAAGLSWAAEAGRLANGDGLGTRVDPVVLAHALFLYPGAGKSLVARGGARDVHRLGRVVLVVGVAEPAFRRTLGAACHAVYPDAYRRIGGDPHLCQGTLLR